MQAPTLPPEIPKEKRLANALKELNSKIDFVEKNRVWRDMLDGGKISDMIVDVAEIAKNHGFSEEQLMPEYRKELQRRQGVFNTAKKPAGIASKVINTASGLAGQALKTGMKAAGPVGAALTAAELGGALSEVRKLGAEKIAAENEAKQAGYTPEERLKLKDMLKKLRAEAKLRE